MYRIIRDSLFYFSLTLILLFVFSAGANIWAQSAGATAASVTGNVVDEQGAVVPGAAVTAKNLDTNLTRETTAGEDGSYLMAQLPPGNYEVTAVADGFSTKTSRI